jgi:hypothetical protein
MGVGRWIGPGFVMGSHSFTPNEPQADRLPSAIRLHLLPAERIEVRTVRRRVTRRPKK